MVLARRDPGGKDRETRTEIQKTATAWLRDYPGFARSPEGQGVQYLLAQSYRREADGVNAPLSDRARDLYDQAERLYAAVEREDGEYTDRARLRRAELLLKRKPELAKGDVGKLATFEQCYTRAQVENALLTEEARKPPADAKAAELQRRQRIRNVVAALDRGLSLAGNEVPVRDRIDARFLFVYFLLLAGDAKRAAETGEELARKYPHSARAATAGAYALHAYSQLLADQEKAFAPAATLDDLRARLRNLALYLETTWPADLAADAARQQLGLLAQRQKNFPEAVAALARVTPAYGQYAQAQFQLAGAALQAAKDKLPPPAGQPGWEDQAAAAYRRIPEPPGDDRDAERVYLYGKIELLKILKP